MQLCCHFNEERLQNGGQTSILLSNSYFHLTALCAQELVRTSLPISEKNFLTFEYGHSMYNLECTPLERIFSGISYTSPVPLRQHLLILFVFPLWTSDLLGLEMHLQVQNHHNNHFVSIWTKHNTHTKSSQILKLPAFQPATLHFNHTDRLAITTNLLLFNEVIKA